VVEAHHPYRPSDDRRPGIPKLPMPPSCSTAGLLAFVTSTADACHFCPSAAPRSLFGKGNPVPHFINVTVVELVQRSSARIASAQSTGQQATAARPGNAKTGIALRYRVREFGGAVANEVQRAMW
jgi:hypothetical protein